MAEAGHFTNANEALAYPTEPTRTPLSFAHVVYLPQNLYAQPPTGHRDDPLQWRQVLSKNQLAQRGRGHLHNQYRAGRGLS